MKINDILELMKLFDTLSLESLEWEGEGERLMLTKKGRAEEGKIHPFVYETEEPRPAVPVKAPVEAAPAPEPEPDSAERFVTAPLVGVFYSQAAPGQPPFVKVGDEVKKGQTLCIIEAMKMMNEITSEIDGVIVDILGENGVMVEYGQNLFKIREA